LRYFGIIMVFLVACGDPPAPRRAPDRTVESPRLIRWSSKFVMHRNLEDNAYYDDHENFIRDYFSVKYEDRRIVATTLIEVNCEDKIQGNIEFSNDTIYLKSVILMTDDRLCSGFHQFQFVISNPGNVRYKVVSTK